MKIFLKITLLLILITTAKSYPQNSYKWQLSDNGGIIWNIQKNDTHKDHIGISGLQISAIVSYGVQNGKLKQSLFIYKILR